MRLAILSDIHSNLEALNRALSVVDSKGADEVICLGDVVGYGGNPNECVDIIRKRCSIVLLGNHDAAALDLSVAQTFTALARVSAEWTFESLSADNKAFLQSLPLSALKEGAFLVHSSPFEPLEWNYIFSAPDARLAFEHFSEEICFVGHSHVPGVFGEKSGKKQVKRGERYIVNVGSVGQPRDGNPNLSFGMFDTEKWDYENVRASYDVRLAAEAIMKAGLPHPLADRLGVGA